MRAFPRASKKNLFNQAAQRKERGKKKDSYGSLLWFGPIYFHTELTFFPFSLYIVFCIRSRNLNPQWLSK